MEQLRWSVVGVGVAGRARARAIEGDARAQLVGVWRGRFAHEIGVPVLGSLDEAISGADVVAVASPTAAHPAQVGHALEAGRHVVVEFPLAPDADTAASLFELARARGRVLHVEHIELLDGPGQTLAALVRRQVVREVTVAFERPGPEEVGPAEIALDNVARLHRACAVAGPVARLERVTAEPGKLSAEGLFAGGASLRLSFRQAPYFARRTTVEVRTATSVWVQQNDTLLRDGEPQTLVGGGPLFPRDQRHASARLLDGAPPYVGEDRILHVLDVVGRLGALAEGPVPQRSDAGSAP